MNERPDSSLDASRDIAAGPASALAPSAALEQELRSFIAEQLGRVLPDTQRARERYYDSVVLGARAAEALETITGSDRPAAGPIIDVGSGLGSFVLLAALQGVPARGVEPGEPELALARRRAGEAGVDPGSFEHGSGERLPVGDGTASAVLLHDVLEHVADWRAVLREAARTLAPGGIVYVKGPSYAFRFFEPHYYVPWLPLLPRPIARRYLATLGRDTRYFDRHIGYRRRGMVLAYLRELGLELSYPRLDKLQDPATIRRPWARRLVRATRLDRRPDSPLGTLIAENPLQSAIDVIARVPAS